RRPGVFLRHVRTQCGSPRTTAGRLLHGDALLYRKLSGVAVDNDSGLRAIQRTQGSIDRAVEATNRIGDRETWSGELQCPSGLSYLKRLSRSVPAVAGTSPGRPCGSGSMVRLAWRGGSVVEKQTTNAYRHSWWPVTSSRTVE